MRAKRRMPETFDVPDLDAMEEFHDDFDDVRGSIIMEHTKDEDLDKLDISS